MRWLLLSSLVLIACSPLPVVIDAGSDGGFTDAGFDAGPAYPPLTTEEEAVLAARPYRLVVPQSYDGGTAVPFVMLLHGYTATGIVQDMYFRMSQLAEARTFILATPDGLLDASGKNYWNATDYCCGSLGTTKTDDVAYLTAIMNDVRLKHRIDPRRVFFVGHSNGGFMSHRMACDRASRVAGIVSLAGAQWKDVTKCTPTEKVPVLQVHGDADLVIGYGGGVFYPGAVETVTDWARLDACDAGTLVSSGAAIDLVSDLAGPETRREGFSACPSGIAVELWTIQNGSHIPLFEPTNTWAPAIYDWLLAHPKP